MNSVIRAIEKEIQQLKKRLQVIEKFQASAPKGSLKLRKRGKKVYFYQQLPNGNSSQWRQEYIKKENFALAKCLAQKQYYVLLKPVIKKHLRELETFLEKYHPSEETLVYEDLSNERKSLVVPFKYPKEEIIQNWLEERYEQGSFYVENLRYETEQGERVRSKSEVIIANILYQHRKDILYKYERPLEIEVEGRSKTIYPDFTILNVHTGKIVYWEHAGGMDDTYYVNEFVKKMNGYVMNHLLPGRDVLVTYETQENPLDIAVVKKLVPEICERE